MNLKSAIVLIISFCVCFFTLQGVNSYLMSEREEEISRQATIILENVKNRFKLLMDVPVIVGTVGADNLVTAGLTKDYGPLAENILKIRKEIYGLNILDSSGTIIKVLPETNNQKALGKKSQNYDDLMKSYENGNPYWFSPPFTLYQGAKGVAFYFPIVAKEKLQGWLAIVLTSANIEKHFSLQKFGEAYDLQVLDKETNRSYYETGIAPLHHDLMQMEETIDGREIVFSSWPLSDVKGPVLSSKLILIVSFFWALISLFVVKLILQRKKSRAQLEDISTLLKLTSKEALSKLIDLEGQIYKMGSFENARYINNLIEQIDLLQTTANARTKFELEDFDFLPLLKSELKEIEEFIHKKAISLSFDPDKFKGITLTANRWLFQNSILGNILTYSILQADTGTGIDLEYKGDSKSHRIIIHTQRAHELEFGGQELKFDRRMTVAQKILAFYHGELKIDRDFGGGLTIQIIFPAA